MEIHEYIDLACARLGGKVLYATDDFFAEKENLLKDAKPIFIVDKYTDRGKWMDGWESRRKRVPGYDWCVVKLGLSGVIRGFDIDTSFFTGNHPPFASVDGATFPEGTSDKTVLREFDQRAVKEILVKSALKADAHNFFSLDSATRFTHLRLNIFPDGGVARLRVYGEVAVDFTSKASAKSIEISGVRWGGRPITCSDKFYSHPKNLLVPERGINMGDGWETKRRRGPGYDWVIIKLGRAAVVEKFVVDTAFFKGNYPDTCSIQGISFTGKDDSLNENTPGWSEALAKTKLQADREHVFDKQISARGPFTHVKLNIYPDGGVSRFRVFGRVV